MSFMHRFFACRQQHPSINSKTIVLWEPCSQNHGEIVPGYAKYFVDLGYEVVVFMTPNRIDEGLFSRFSHPRLHLTSISQRQIRRFMKTQEIHSAAGILISTASKIPKDKYGGPDLSQVFNGIPPHNVHFVEHDMSSLQGIGDRPSGVITLKDLSPKYGKTHVVNPHFFGNIEKTPKNSFRTVLLMVGAARAKRRNDHLVINAAERLIAGGYKNFEIRLVGKSDGVKVPRSLRDNFIKLGRLSFSDLYNEVESCDFLLTAFQKDNPAHVFYKTTGTSGSLQLCYGFSKPGIFQMDYIDGTAINRYNSLLYDRDEEVFDAMRSAIDMSSSQYKLMQTAMIDSANQLAERSQSNLRELFFE